MDIISKTILGIIFLLFLIAYESDNEYYHINPKNYITYHYDGKKAKDAIYSYANYLGVDGVWDIVPTGRYPTFGVNYGKKRVRYVQASCWADSSFTVQQISYEEFASNMLIFGISYPKHVLYGLPNPDDFLPVDYDDENDSRE